MADELWPPETPGIVYPYGRLPSDPVNRSEVSEELWGYLRAHGWYVTKDNPDRAYPPQRPMIVTSPYGSASAVGMEIASGPRDSTISEYSRTGTGTDWRYIAQRAITGEFLDMDLPLHRDELTWELSGPGALRGTISPDVGLLRAEDGRLLLEEWGTLIYAEADGEIRWGGILINSHWDGANWEIECAGFSTYPGGQPYGAEFSQTGADPGEVIRHIWEHLQSYQDGNLNVRVTNSVTGAMVGLPKGPVTRDQVPLSVWDYLQRANWTYRDGDTTGRIYPPGYDGQIPPNSNSDPLDPYELLWWEAPDCGTAIDNLVRDVPLDYVERHAWDGNKIRHEIQLSYPRCGRRRNDLAFIQGDNVVSVVAPETDGEYYANFVLGLGAGEGSGAIRRTTAQSDGRLRRASVYSGKDTTSAAQLDNAIANELRKRQNLLKIDSIEVQDHPNAPIGSWALGDDILVRANIPWLGDIELWCRITGWSLTSNTRATLRLERSDAFSYAAEETNPGEGPITRNGEDVPYPASSKYPEDHGLFPNDPAVA